MSMAKHALLAAVGAACGLIPAAILIGLAVFLGPSTPDDCTETQLSRSTPGCGVENGDASVNSGGLPGAPEPFTGAPGGHLVDPSGTWGWVTRATAHLYAQTRFAFPHSGWSCWDPHEWNPTSDHPQGRACDITFGNAPGVMPSPAQRERGWRIARWLRQYADTLRVDYLIYDGQIWSAGDQAWRPYISDIYDTTTPTGGHYDHVHVSVAS